MNGTGTDLEQVAESCRQLTESIDTVMLATVDREGNPEASYAAYLKYQGDFYVYVSDLAIHARNLSANGRVSLLFIEDEAKASNVFARRRATFQGRAEEVSRDSEAFELILDLFEQKFGSLIEMLKNLKDFHLFRIHPIKGSFVQGFARAFTIEGAALDSFRQVTGAGHQGAPHGGDETASE